MLILAAGLGGSIVTARSLGPEGRGQYYAIMTLAAIVAQFGNLGFSSSNTFLASREPRVSWALVANGLWVCMVVALVSALVMAGAGTSLAERLAVPEPLLWAVCLIGPAMLGFTLGSSVLVANERFMALNVWQIANALLAVALLIGCAAAGAEVIAFVLATCVAAILTVIGLTIDLARGHTVSLRFDWSLFRRGLGFGSRAYVILLLGFLIQRAAVTLLATYRDAHDIGLFSVAAQIYDVLVIVPTSVGMVLFPMLIRQTGGSWETTRQALLATVGLMLVACTGVAAIGRPIISFVFGAEFAPSFDVLLWLLPGVLFISATTVMSQFVVKDGFPSVLIVWWAAGLVVCLVSGVPLTQTHGASGAAAAQSLGMAVVCAGISVLTLRRISAPEGRGVLRQIVR